MGFLFGPVIAGLASATLLASSAQASMVYGGKTPAMATDQTLSNSTNNGIGWNGRKETFTFAGLPLNVGLNTLAFAHLSLNDDHAGFQGLRDEGWGGEKVEVSATPLPPTSTMMLIGLGGFGWVTKRLRRKETAFSVA